MYGIGISHLIGLPRDKQTSESLKRLFSCPAIFSYRQGAQKRGIPWTGIQLRERTHLLSWRSHEMLQYERMMMMMVMMMMMMVVVVLVMETQGTISSNKCADPTGCGMQLGHLALE
jgi:hypothetical protein